MTNRVGVDVSIDDDARRAALANGVNSRFQDIEAFLRWRLRGRSKCPPAVATKFDEPREAAAHQETPSLTGDPMWLAASALFLTNPAPEVLNLETCETGTLPAQVIAIGTEPFEVFMLAPDWGDPRFETRCKALYADSLCDPGAFVYPSREEVGSHIDLTNTNLRYSILLQRGRPLEGHIEGFRGRAEVFDFAFDLETGAVDPRPEIDRLRDGLVRQIFTGAL